MSKKKCPCERMFDGNCCGDPAICNSRIGKREKNRMLDIEKKFLLEINYGNPAPIEFGQSKNPLYRFLIYLNI